MGATSGATEGGIDGSYREPGLRVVDAEVGRRRGDGGHHWHEYYLGKAAVTAHVGAQHFVVGLHVGARAARGAGASKDPGATRCYVLLTVGHKKRISSPLQRRYSWAIAGL